MTQLRIYITQTQTKQSCLAEALGISRGYLSELVGGTKRPGLDLACAIERITKGAVPVACWVTSKELGAEVLAQEEKGAA
ncbi:hypothetical protein D1114_23325 [Cereibacter sphaeroides]|uniref:HTH cro/C1-type domain-containing protein n=1 Tax=Cereibacter sphaeroides TaxID=1063 RepID=A0AAX1UEB4_CERSP|nr:hypothetical protein [Cereibacter sphaeroides]RHZ90423.1 hypothetical protein D1114_23325 [Cereibacter sphaeroides]